MPGTGDSMGSNSEGNESGWDIVVGVLLVQVVMSLVASEYPSRSTPAAGSPMTGLSAVFFLFWGIVFLVAPHYQQRSVLFRFLNARNDSSFVGGGFLLVSVWLFATWAGYYFWAAAGRLTSACSRRRPGVVASCGIGPPRLMRGR